MFANDTAILAKGQNLGTAADKLQPAKTTITQWLSKWSLNINHNKCVAKIFTLRHINHHNTYKPSPNKLENKLRMR